MIQMVNAKLNIQITVVHVEYSGIRRYPPGILSMFVLLLLLQYFLIFREEERKGEMLHVSGRNLLLLFNVQ